AAMPLPIMIVAISRAARIATARATGRMIAPGDHFTRPVQRSQSGRGLPSSHSSTVKMHRRKRISSGAITRRLRTSLFFCNAAEPAGAPGIVTDGCMKLLCSEVGPVDAGDVELGVADLPKKIVAHAQFAGGADQEVGVGEAGGIEAVGYQVFV